MLCLSVTGQMWENRSIRALALHPMAPNHIWRLELNCISQQKYHRMEEGFFPLVTFFNLGLDFSTSSGNAVYIFTQTAHAHDASLERLLNEQVSRQISGCRRWNGCRINLR